ncbi:MAG TPA: superoxide dismutase family protein [Candidatus Limnocylindrales bacterium]|nr:superoxide dismutase family protein [Candidatus Limnocylindrales bacterium]
MSVRRLFAVILPVGALLALTAATSAAGARQAGGTFVDADGNTVGWVQLVEDASGVVHVNVKVSGLAPGRHGIHIHAIGACSPTFAAAGPHYNPLGHQHGLLNPNGSHAGDLPNLIVNGDGMGRLNATTDHITISPGPTTLFDATPGAEGSAFIIHANEDDQLTDATNGNSGARIACAVIEPE